MQSVDFYFDFISPYSWLALSQAENFAAEHKTEFRLRPLVYAKLLDATGLVGPVEAVSKRRYTFVDVLRSARSVGLPFEGPPAHPFNSLRPLRLVTCELGDPPLAMRLAVAIAAAAWQNGRDITDLAVLTDVAESVGVDTTDLQARIKTPEVKAELKACTDEGLAVGVFGVPTFVHQTELFWGFDRMAQLADVLDGRRDSIAAEQVEHMLDRPSSARRRAQ